MPFKVYTKVQEGNLETKMNSLYVEGEAVIQVMMQPQTESSERAYTIITTEIPGYMKPAPEQEKVNGNS